VIRPIVIDASIALKWVIVEDQHQEARRLVSLAPRFTAPDIMLAEVANVLRKKVRRKEVEARQALVAIDGIRQVVPIFEHSDRIAKRMLELAIELDHHAYDCAYLALGERVDGILVTADRLLVDKLRQSALQIDVCPLGDASLMARLLS